MGRANRSASGTVAGLKRRSDIIWRPGPGANTLQRSDKTAHLIVQKAARGDFNMDLIANTGKMDPLHFPHR